MKLHGPFPTSHTAHYQQTNKDPTPKSTNEGGQASRVNTLASTTLAAQQKIHTHPVQVSLIPRKKAQSSLELPRNQQDNSLKAPKISAKRRSKSFRNLLATKEQPEAKKTLTAPEIPLTPSGVNTNQLKKHPSKPKKNTHQAYSYEALPTYQTTDGSRAPVKSVKHVPMLNSKKETEKHEKALQDLLCGLSKTAAFPLHNTKGFCLEVAHQTFKANRKSPTPSKLSKITSDSPIVEQAVRESHHGLVAYKQLKPLLRTLHKYIHNFILFEQQRSEASQQLCSNIKELLEELNGKTRTGKLTPDFDPEENFRTRLETCLSDKKFGKLISNVLGGKKKVKQFCEEISSLKEPEAAQTVKEQVAEYIRLYSKAMRTCKRGLSWTEPSAENLPLDKISSSAVIAQLPSIKFIIGDTPQTPSTDEAREKPHEAVSIYNTLLQLNELRPCPDKFKPEEIAKHTIDLLAKEEIPESSILRLTTIECWQRAHMMLREEVPPLFGPGRRQRIDRTIGTSAHIKMEGNSDFSVTQKRQYTFHRDDGVGERTLFKWLLRWKIVDHNPRTGKLSRKFPKFVDATPEEVIEMLNILAEPASSHKETATPL